MNNKFILYPSLLCAILLASCNNNKVDDKKSTEPLAVPVTTVEVLDTIVANEYISDIQAIKNVEIRARINGFLEKIFVDEGDIVKKGQLLFKINDQEFQIQLASANALLKTAMAEAKTISLEVEQTKLLFNKKIVSKIELDLADAKLAASRAKIDEAKAQVNLAQTRINYTNVRAPYDGAIDRIALKEGSLVTEGTFLTNISDLSQVYAYFDISEKQFLEMMQDSAYKNGNFKKPVSLALANGQTFSQTGIAELAESQFDGNTGSISLRAKFNNTGQTLRHGSSGKIIFPTKLDNIVAVHQKSVFEIQDRTFVYVVKADNTIKMTPFTAAERIGHYYVVEEGLQPNEKIVYEGTQALKDGERINPKAATTTVQATK
ncbi:efflux RND transporter periplasmic adaptor subunit [Sphingobacteriaceae bacterium WQ 2009]|uniref:Efflux RND transporter periplasmic adaptor subunit n=1 Tax=Rhinopithecimicrobium faecis TaxID=2820698 RepID=A0A8T4H9B6_9SPHI|nr:efflux RND transporter periplasmic adaptor subunit [Sphingobacteriaceae bacterium WQ 2009]